jgi:hypothetical protein
MVMYMKMGASKTEVMVSALLQYLEGIDDIPLSQRLAKIEGKMRELEAELKPQIDKLQL